MRDWNGKSGEMRVHYRWSFPKGTLKSATGYEVARNMGVTCTATLEICKSPGPKQKPVWGWHLLQAGCTANTREDALAFLHARILQLDPDIEFPNSDTDSVYQGTPDHTLGRLLIRLGGETKVEGDGFLPLESRNCMEMMDEFEDDLEDLAFLDGAGWMYRLTPEWNVVCIARVTA